AAFVERTKKEIRAVVDAMHGRGDVAPSPGRGGGIYADNVAENVAALLLGGDFDVTVKSRTDLSNIGKVSFNGQYLSIQDATASEVWYVQMLDYMVSYETSTYNWQHPVAMVNVFSDDPVRNPTEARVQVKPLFQAGLFAAFNSYPYFPEFVYKDPLLLRAADSEGLNPTFGYLQQLRSRIRYPLVVTEFGIPASHGVGRFH